MDITKLRLIKNKNGYGLELSYERPGPNGDKIAVAGEAHTAIIHHDLFNAVQSLGPHLAMMAFHVKESDVDIVGKFNDFSVGSYSISGKEEKRGIIISGTLRKAGKAHNFNTPFYRFQEPESGRYEFMNQVEEILGTLEKEVASYLDGTKRGEQLQPELAMGSEPVTKIKIADADPEAMARVANMPNGKTGGKKKVQQTASAPSGEVQE